MLYVDSDLNEWCKKHGLEVEEIKCSNCDLTFKTKVPIIIRGYAGLEMEQHGCDPRFYGAIFTPISEEEVNSWNNII